MTGCGCSLHIETRRKIGVGGVRKLLSHAISVVLMVRPDSRWWRLYGGGFNAGALQGFRPCSGGVFEEDLHGAILNSAQFAEILVKNYL